MLKKLVSTRPRKIAAVVLVAAMAMTGTGIATAYFVSHGTGSGSAPAPVGQASNNSLNVLVNPPTSSQAMLPGGPAQPFSFSVTNPTPVNETMVQNMTVSVTGTSVSGCLASWFTINPGTIRNGSNNVTVPFMLGNNEGPQADSAGWTVQMNDSGTNQSVCEGASVTISVVIT